jgi:hypothetical protein
MSGLPNRKLSVDCAAGMLGSKMWRSGCGVRSAGRSNVRRKLLHRFHFYAFNHLELQQRPL